MIGIMTTVTATTTPKERTRCTGAAQMATTESMIATMTTTPTGATATMLL